MEIHILDPVFQLVARRGSRFLRCLCGAYVIGVGVRQQSSRSPGLSPAFSRV